MTPLGILFTLIASVALLRVPRRWAPLPLVMGACYMTLGQGISLGPFSFTVIRILILIGFIRVWVRGERIVGGMLGLDWVLVAWAVWALVVCILHDDYLVGQLGLIFNTLGTYFLIRVFCDSRKTIIRLIQIVAIMLAPVAMEMILEQITGKNLFSFLGGVPEAVTVRNDRLRAQGPFAHGILAGTVGAVCLPLMAAIWRTHKKIAILGGCACLTIVVASSSSGPIMSLLFGLVALGLWRYRHLTRHMRVAAVVGYIMLDLIMKAPAYFVIARIDLTGSSTGWHRAELIKQAIAHLDEWWLAGTEYTRHWMPTGVTWSADHCDITNHYIGYGMIGGLPLMGLYIAALVVAFRYIGQVMAQDPYRGGDKSWLAWVVGASLFAHAATGVSVYYFDQSFVFLYLSLAITGSLRGAGIAER